MFHTLYWIIHSRPTVENSKLILISHVAVPLIFKALIYKAQAVEFADISFTSDSLSLPKAKNVLLSRNTSASPTIVKKYCDI